MSEKILFVDGPRHGQVWGVPWGASEVRMAPRAESLAAWMTSGTEGVEVHQRVHLYVRKTVGAGPAAVRQVMAASSLKEIDLLERTHDALMFAFLRKEVDYDA